jgi:hypothetical protein
VALGLGLACSTLAALLYRSYAEQSRLSALLAKREGDLAKMVGGVGGSVSAVSCLPLDCPKRLFLQSCAG